MMGRKPKEKESPYKAVIEWEIRNYRQTKKDHAEHLENLVGLSVSYPTNDAEMIRGSDTSDPTGRKAVKLATCIELMQTRKLLDALEKTFEEYKTSAPDKYRFIDGFYWHKWGLSEASQKCNATEVTLHSWRNELVALIASRMGWKV